MEQLNLEKSLFVTSYCQAAPSLPAFIMFLTQGKELICPFMSESLFCAILNYENENLFFYNFLLQMKRKNTGRLCSD